MTVTPEQFDRAFNELQAFGPRRAADIETRWREILPEVPPREFPALLMRCDEVEAFAFRLAERVRDNEITPEIMLRRLAREYPFLTDERLQRTYGQAMLFASK